MKKKRSSKANKKTFWKRIQHFFLFTLLGVVTVSIFLVCLTRYIQVPTSAFMLNQHIDDFQKDKGFIKIKHQWVDYENISPLASAAVIAAEDQRFYQHSGFDFNAIVTALEDHLDGDKLRGASTISQQVAKNLFLSPSRSFWRKGAEVWFTVLIELFWDKRRIIEVYLNIAEMGDHLFGIEAASRHFFGISAKSLSARQAALLAATLPNPKRLLANRPTEYLLKRQRWILQQMPNINPVIQSSI